MSDGVTGVEAFPGDQPRDDRRLRRQINSITKSQQQGESVEHPKLDRAAHGEDCEDRHEHHPAEVGVQHHRSRGEPAKERAAEQQEHRTGSGGDGYDRPHGENIPGELQDQPRKRD